MEHSGAQNQDTHATTGTGTAGLTGEVTYHILSNRVHFFLDHALIIVYNRDVGTIYRLVVFHKGEFLTDLVYYSLRGAKIAFIKFHLRRAYKEGIVAHWSDEEDGDLNRLDKPSLPPLPPLPYLKP